MSKEQTKLWTIESRSGFYTSMFPTKIIDFEFYIMDYDNNLNLNSLSNIT